MPIPSTSSKCAALCQKSQLHDGPQAPQEHVVLENCNTLCARPLHTKDCCGHGAPRAQSLPEPDCQGGPCSSRRLPVGDVGRLGHFKGGCSASIGGVMDHTHLALLLALPCRRLVRLLHPVCRHSAQHKKILMLNQIKPMDDSWLSQACLKQDPTANGPRGDFQVGHQTHTG